ncbi:hypothetical protein RIF29_22170 [Crotalaria pallida]|uniref:Uncharacterized protein n=1 Tax=Crotalaria pallida TaxID=3830 RepID=A0AAN9F4H6_CROPI
MTHGTSGGWHKWKGLVPLKHVVVGSSRTRDACEWSKPYWEHRPRKDPTVGNVMNSKLYIYPINLPYPSSQSSITSFF